MYCNFMYLGKVVSQKLQVAGLAKYSLSPGLKPYKIVAYIPGSNVCNVCNVCMYVCMYVVTVYDCIKA